MLINNPPYGNTLKKCSLPNPMCIVQPIIGCKVFMFDDGGKSWKWFLLSDASGLKENGWETGGTSFWAPNGQPLESN